MSYLSRIANVFRRDRLSSEIDEELQSHIEEAIASGRDPEEVRRRFGSALRVREECSDSKLTGWLDSLRADVVFGWRQLLRNRVASGAAIVSLALAIGACTSAFRLIDAVLLRPLPVTGPERLFVLTYQTMDRDGKLDTGDSFDYPQFRELRSAAKDDAELLAISYSVRIDVTYGSDHDMEKAHRQYVSGAMFGSFGVRPALGRVLGPNDDVKPGAHPYAVLSYDYWNRRFGRDPKAIGKTVRIGNDLYEIVGVSEEGFTGTDTGAMTDIFVPTMMNARAIEHPNWGWFRTWVHVRPGVSADAVRERLQAAFTTSRKERMKTEQRPMPAQRLQAYVNAPVALQPAAAGMSGMQKNYRRSLLILGVVVGLVLLIACVNVANLMTAQASARARELALRVSIGAGRARLVQLVLVESAMLAIFASLLGGAFAWWSAPFVVSMINPPDDPLRLALPADWRVLGFATGLTVLVTVLFGLLPALRASAVKPMSALRGGEDALARPRLMNALVAAQVAFCFLVHFTAGLFVATFDRLSKQPTGFVADGVMIVEIMAKAQQPASHWLQTLDHIRTLRDVEIAGTSSWALMSSNEWSSDVWINGRQAENTTYFLSISPQWINTMRIPLVDGRDFREDDVAPNVAIVTRSFARRFFDGASPTGKSFERMNDGKLAPTRIVGVVDDVRYSNMRDAIRPVVFLPFRSLDAKNELRATDWMTVAIRTKRTDPMALAGALRTEVPRVRPELRVANIRTQDELVRQHSTRERLLATLSLFFAGVALILAAVGLYGVLSFSVLQRRREIGIRMALGAQPAQVARQVTTEVFGWLFVGATAGLVAGVASERYFETILYQVRVTDVSMLAIPVLTIFAAALIAALPPVLHAVRIDPAVTLRAE